MSLSYCPECLKKQQRINELEEEVVQLKARLRYQERTAAEGPFGSSTPSSKVPVKPDTLPERQARRGGARAGHVGHGRASVPPEAADRVADVPLAATTCPHCGETLLDHGKRRRTVFDLPPVRRVRIVYRLGRKRCPRCGRTVQAHPPGVPPKGLFGNGLLTHVATLKVPSFAGGDGNKGGQMADLGQMILRGGAFYTMIDPIATFGSGEMDNEESDPHSPSAEFGTSGLHRVG